MAIKCVKFEPDTSGRMWVSIDDFQFSLTGVGSREELFDDNGELVPEAQAAINEFVIANKEDPKFAEEFIGCLNLDHLDYLPEEIEAQFDLTDLELDEEGITPDGKANQVPISFYKLTPVEQIKRFKDITYWSRLQGDSDSQIVLVDENGEEIK